MTATVPGPDGKPRCRWCALAPEFFPYHDQEWGFPVGDDRRLFEKLCLEGFQSGLSWRTILVKRGNFRDAFQNFDFTRIARYAEDDVRQLMLDTGIVRHRGKIEAVVNNARLAGEMVAREGSLAAFFWRYEQAPGRAVAPQTTSTSAESLALSKALNKLGWKFVGPTTVFAFMQAAGLVNDHAEGCIIRDKVRLARESFQLPVSTSVPASVGAGTGVHLKSP